MPSCRCYFRDSDSRTNGTGVVASDEDDTLAVQAELLLAERASCVTVEVWQGRWLVYRSRG